MTAQLLPEHNKRTRYAVLLLHTGGPRDVSWWEVWRYLSLKLSEKRLVQPIPSWLWAPFLYCFVLPSRVASVRKAQESMWIRHSDPVVDLYLSAAASPSPPLPTSSKASTADVPPLLASNSAMLSSRSEADHGPGYSPSVYYTAKLCDKVQQQLNRRLSREDVSVQIECAFIHQQDSVEQALERLHLLGSYSGITDTNGHPAVVKDEQLILLPLFPQYNPFVTATAFDAVTRSSFFTDNLKIPHMHFCSSYCANPHYIIALERHIRQFFRVHGPPSWLFVVFPSSLKSFMEENPVYESECFRTFAYLRRVLSHSRGPPLLRTSSSMENSITSQGSSGRTAPTQHNAWDTATQDGASYCEFQHTGRRFSDYNVEGIEGGNIGYEKAFPQARIRLLFLPCKANEGDDEGRESVMRKGTGGASARRHHPQEVLRAAFHAERMDGVTVASESEGNLSPMTSTDVTPRQTEAIRRRHSGAAASSTTDVTPRTAEDGAECQTRSSGKVYVVCPGTVVEDVNTLLTLQTNLLVQCERWWRQVEYIPALNDCQEHTDLILELLAEWVKV